MKSFAKPLESERFAPCASCAVGVPKAQEQPQRWYIAVLHHNTEKSAFAQLQGLDCEAFLPTQKYTSVWKDGRKKERERVLLTGKIFVRCTEAERLEIVKLPFILRFMTDAAARRSDQQRSPLAIVPDEQMERFRFMLGQSDHKVEITDLNFRRGDTVRVVRGSLTGLEGTMTGMSASNMRVSIQMAYGCCASVMVSAADIELVAR